MGIARRLAFLTAVLAISSLVAACASRTIGDPAVPDTSPPDVPTDAGTGLAIVDFTYMNLTDPANLAAVARAEVYINESSYLWSPTVNQGAVADLKTLNPNLKVLGYVNAHTTWLAWGADAANAISSPYTWDWYQATKPFWSSTTTGDTMISWPGKVVLDVLDPACRDAMIEVLATHWNAHSNVLDGIYWDHFNMALWVSDNIAGREGQLDLDHDGVAHLSDPDEMEAYRAASSSMVLELRARLGDDIIIVANGDRAARDSTFAGLVDGMLYENFPEVGFGGLKMAQALDPAVANSLFNARSWPRTRNGGPYLILSHKDRFGFNTPDGMRWYPYAEYARVAALLTGTLASFHSEDMEFDYGWPEIEFDLGEPLAAAEFTGDVISRRFANGVVSLQMTAGALPLPFSYSIIQGQEVVQSLDFPSVFP